MKLLNFPFLILTISIFIGILVGYYFPVDIKSILIIVSIGVISLGISWLNAKKIFKKGHAFSVLTIIVFITFGIALVSIHNPTRFSDHYTNILPSENLINESQGVQFHIKERLKPTSYYEKYIASLTFINNKAVSGNVLVRIPKDSTSQILSIGDTYTAFSTLKLIPKPLNPYQFDYASYLHKKYIFYQLTISPDQFVKTGKPIRSLYRIADQIRQHISQKLSPYNFSATQLSIINALLLGQRQDIDINTFTDYRNAGAIHILAISGLHVGILLMILNLILKPLEWYRKKNRFLKTTIIILLLWCFAMITGLSPSVLRAVTMFSFITIGLHIRSKTSVYNALLVSICILLFFNPLLVFSIGFQLSYLAVFAIVWLQPSIATYYKPRFYIDKKLWETFTVTITAQLGLLPLSLFYFHQFPLLFFVSNLIIIPVLGFILGFGILVITLAEIEYLPDFMVVIFGKYINGMNSIVHWIGQQEGFLITEISFSWSMLIASYALMTTLILVYKKYTPQRLLSTGLSSVLLLCVMIYEKHKNATIEELVVYNDHSKTTISILEQGHLSIYHKDSIAEINSNYFLNDYRIHHNIQSTTSKKLMNVYRYKERTLLIIDSAAIYRIKGLKPDIILLSNSPKIHLGKVINKLRPTKIIADGSNYKRYIHEWELSCKKQKISFHRTDKNGAFILKDD